MSDKMEFKISLHDYDLEGFERTIIDELAERLWNREGSSIRNAVEEKFMRLVDSRVQEILAPIVEDALSQPLQRTDAFGKPVGDPMSMKDVISGSAVEYLETHVDPNGKPREQTRYSSSDPRRIDRIVRELIDRDFSSDIEKEKNAAIRELRGQLKSAAAAWFAEFQGKAKSAIDKAVA